MKTALIAVEYDETDARDGEAVVAAIAALFGEFRGLRGRVGVERITLVSDLVGPMNAGGAHPVLEVR